MATNNTDPKSYKEKMDLLVATITAGIAHVETGGETDPYRVKNGNAVGKYQFMPEWLDKSVHKGSPIMGIKEFVRSQDGVWNRGEITMETFRNDPAMQDAYFDYYVKNWLIPEATKAISKIPEYKGDPAFAPAVITLDQAAAMFHFQDYKTATTAITTGKFPEATEHNPSGSEYLSRYNKAVQEQGFNNISAYEMVEAKGEAVKDSTATKEATPAVVKDSTATKAKTADKPKPKKEKKEEVKLTPAEQKIANTAKDRMERYAKRDQAINAMDADTATKEKLRRQFWKDVANAGDQQLLDKYYRDENAKAKKAWEEEINAIGNEEIKAYNKEISKLTTGSGEKFIDGAMEIFSKAHTLLTGGLKDDVPYFSDRRKLLEEARRQLRDEGVKGMNNFSGMGVETPEIYRRAEKILKDRVFADFNAKQAEENPFYAPYSQIDWETINAEAQKDREVKVKEAEAARAAAEAEKAKTSTSTSTSTGDTSTSTSDTPGLADPEPKTKSEGETASETQEKEKTYEEEVKAEIDKANGKTESSSDLGLASQYAAGELEEADRLRNKQEVSYDAKNIKKEIPWNSIAGATLGLIGDDKANAVDVPKREEQLSPAFEHIVGELAKKSKDGLPPHIEAAMKDKLSEAYQGGLASTVNAAAGNRALVLGNQGQLETARNRGLVDIQLADYEAKERAFAQYAEAIKYKEDFNTRREIANHAIDYQEAMIKRQEGKDLATAGFKMLIDDINYQRDNGPGSVNDMLRSYTEQSIFGYDTKAKKGAPNSKEAYDAKNMEKQGLSADREDLGNKIYGLAPEKQQIVSSYLKTNQTREDVKGLVNYLYENPDISASSFDASRMTEASQRKDPGLLFNINTEPQESETIAAEDLMPQTEKPSANGVVKPEGDFGGGLLGGIGTAMNQVASMNTAKDDFNNVLEKENGLLTYQQ